MYTEIVPTKAEKLLWRALTKARISFLSNEFINGWEVDLLIEKRIIVEVDGYIHIQKSVIEKDRRKDKELKEAGYIIIRFSNDECYYDIKKCLKKINTALTEVRVKKMVICNDRKTLQPWQLKLKEYYRNYESPSTNKRINK